MKDGLMVVGLITGGQSSSMYNKDMYFYDLSKDMREVLVTSINLT